MQLQFYHDQSKDNSILLLWLKLAKYIIKVVGKGSLEYVADRPFNDYRYYIDNSKLCSLGWEPVANFYDKLNEIIKYELSKKKTLDVNNYLNELIHK